MVQVQGAKTYPGFSVVYPDGVNGIKVIRTFTQGPAKIINSDGSTSYSIPPPTIHELWGGGFSYADGSPVKERKHLEILPEKMKERALIWFDNKGTIAIQDDVPTFVQDKKESPEPAWILSNEQINEISKDTTTIPSVDSTKLDAIVRSIDVLTEFVMKQAEEINHLKSHPIPIVSSNKKLVGTAQSLNQSARMKEKWANPEFKANFSKRMKEVQEKKRNARNKQASQTVS